MTKQNPQKNEQGLYVYRNVIDTRTGQHHPVAQIKHKADAQWLEDAEPITQDGEKVTE